MLFSYSCFLKGDLNINMYMQMNITLYAYHNYTYTVMCYVLFYF